MQQKDLPVFDKQQFLEKRRLLFLNNQETHRNILIQKSRQNMLNIEQNKQQEIQLIQEDLNKYQNDLQSPIELELDNMTLQNSNVSKNKQKYQHIKKINKSAKNQMKKYSQMLIQYDCLVQIPNNLQTEFMIIARPQGIRCLVYNNHNTIIIRDKNGVILKNLQKENISENFPKDNIYLDCIFDSYKKIFFVIDMIQWKQQEMYMNNSELRFFFIEQNFPQYKKQLNESDKYIFYDVPRFHSSVQNIINVYQQDFGFSKEGLLFVNKEALYIGEHNPNFLIWKDDYCSLYTIETQKDQQLYEVITCLQLRQDKCYSIDNFCLFIIDNKIQVQLQLKQNDLIKISCKGLIYEQVDDQFRVEMIGPRLIGKCSQIRQNPDCLSKIIYQLQLRNQHPGLIKFEQLSIEQQQN